MLFLALNLLLIAVPQGSTPVDRLSNGETRHAELLRIERDFGDENLHIVLDGWIPQRSKTIEDVRLWWLHKDQNGLRSPFGEATRKHFTVRYEYVNASHWNLHLTADHKKFAFSVELEPNGQLSAFADIRTSSGQIVPHCRASRGKIIAKKFLGAALGIKRFQLTCFDDAGTRHTGSILTQS